MVWFIVAALITTGSNTVDFKINQYSQFKSESECVDYINTYDSSIKAGLTRGFPNSKVIDIRCLNTNAINKMQEYIKQNGELLIK